MRNLSITHSAVCGILIMSLISVLLVPSGAAYSEEPSESLAGDVYFDFAFRDEAGMLFRGVAGEPVAQDDGDASDADDAGAAGNGLAQGAAARTDVPPDALFRVADLKLNCDMEKCRNARFVEALLKTTGLELGHQVKGSDLALSIERLRKTGYFSNIHQTLAFQGERVEVTFDAVPHTTIRKIIIESHGSLYESEVKKRMILRPGGVLYPRTVMLRGMDVDDIPKEKLMQMALEDQEKSLARMYVKEGFFDAKVRIDPEVVDTDLVDLHVHVTDADSYVLGKVYVRGHKVKSYAEIEDTFRSGFSIFGGVTKAEIEDAVTAVLHTYRSEGYYQTKIDFVSRLVPESKSVDVFLDITESYHWDVQIEGNASLSTKELMNALTFESSGFVDNGEVAASATAIQQTYVSAGYYWARVVGEMHWVGEQTHVISFKVEEGERAEIDEIVFSGAAALSRDALMKVISSKEYSAFGSGAYPQRSMIADDAAKIVDAYREHGYLSADVPRWTLAQIGQTGRYRLTFIVHEGEQSHFAHRQIRYKDRETYDKFDVLIDKPESNVFSDSVFRAERASITKQLRARGHATISDRVRCTSYGSDGSVASEETCEIAEIPTSCFPDDVEDLCEVVETRDGKVEKCRRHFDTEYGLEGEQPCEARQGVTGTDVDVEYEVTLGPKYSFGDVFVHGNVNTRLWVVDQDIPFESGETFDFNKVIDARSLLRRRTIYKSATLNAIGIDDDLAPSMVNGDSTSSTARDVPLVVNLEEGERRWFDFALGVQYTGGDLVLTGEMEYVEANLLGTGWDLRLLVMPEARLLSNNTEFVFTQKFNQNFFTLLTLAIPVIPASGFNIVTQLFYDLRYIPDTNKEQFGWLVELQWNVSKAWFTALAFELESSRTGSTLGTDRTLDDYHACYPVTFFMTCPFSEDERMLTVSLTPRMYYDGRDNPLMPKYGFYAEGKIKLAYSNSVGFYLKPEARASYVYTFLQYFTLAFNLRFGLSFLSEDQSLPLIDRYFLGGLNMRGYDNEALGPRLVIDYVPGLATNSAAGGEVLFNFTAEMRFPVWESVGIYGALFMDMGSLTQYQPTHYGAASFARELFADQMRYTAGLGLRWLISEAIPPIVIDYGFILNRRRGDPLGGFSLNVGYTF
ncbi:MAG: BamA/TamA family outer membrane protein [Proteobacteria bacterium]|nr:BamA/TamA family outer membrane protein [Pseudomonadota bacterium]